MTKPKAKTTKKPTAKGFGEAAKTGATVTMDTPATEIPKTKKIEPTRDLLLEVMVADAKIEQLTKAGKPRQRAPRRVDPDIKAAYDAVVEAKEFLNALRREHAQARKDSAGLRAAARVAKLEAQVAKAQAALEAAKT